MQTPVERVLADVRSTGAPEPSVDASYDPDDPETFRIAMTGTVLGLRLVDSPIHRLLAVTEAVQEWMIEELGRRGSNWPRCPHHPSTHPLQAVEHDGDVWWICPADGTPVAQVGSLAG